jgi:hypothetical protein
MINFIPLPHLPNPKKRKNPHPSNSLPSTKWGGVVSGKDSSKTGQQSDDEDEDDEDEEEGAQMMNEEV